MRFLLFLLFATLAFASQEPSPTDLATLQGDISAVVCDCVNAITGELLIDQDDHIVSGAIPLRLHRRQVKKESFPFFAHTKANISFSGELMTANVFERSGIGLPYHSRDTKNLAKVRCKLSVDTCNNGMTHSPGYNLSENVVEYCGKELTLIQSNGAKRIYQRINRKTLGPCAFTEDFFLKEEILETGQVIEYEWNSFMIKEVRILNPSRTQVYSKITRQDLSFTSSDGSQIQHKFKHGLLVKALLPHLPVEKQKRNSDGYIKKRIFPEGRVCKFKYDDKGRVQKLIFPEGIEYLFKYKRGHTTVIRPENAQMDFYFDPKTLRLEKIEHEGRVETFKWDDWGYLIEKALKGYWKLSFVYDEKHNLLKKTKNNYSIHYAYDEANRVIEEREENGLIKKTSYIGSTLLPKEVAQYRNERFLKRTIYQYDEDLLLISERIEGDDASCILINRYERRKSAPFYGMIAAIEKLYGDEEHLLGRTEYIYDSHGQVVHERIIDSEGNLRYKIERTYDSKGRLLSETDSERNLTRYEYDENSNVIRENHPNGLEIERRFDPCNRLLNEKEGDYTTSYSYWMFQDPQTQQDYLGAQRQFYYDKRGNCKAEKCEGAVWRFSFNSDNQITSATDPNGNKTGYEYDENGNITRKFYPDASQELYKYNPDGTLASYTQQNGTRIEYLYDDFGNVCSEIFYSHEGLEIGKTSKAYNAFHLLEEVDLEGNQSHYSYDGAGRLIEKNESGRIISYRYDSLGRVIEEKIGDHRIIKVYNLLNQVICEEDWSNNELLTRIETQYDLPNRIVEVQQAGSMTRTTYDPHGRETRIDRPDGSHISYEYTVGHKQLIKKTHEPHLITKTEVFDHNERLVQFEKRNEANEQINLIEYEYDQVGNLRFQKRPLGSHVLEMRYDNMDRKTHEIECEQKITQFSYTPSGEIETIIKPDGVVLSYEYDHFGFLSRLFSSDHTVNYHFEHDKLGRLLRSTDFKTNRSTERTLDPFGNILEENLANGYTLKSTYDAQSRRTLLSLPTKKEIQFTYLGPYLQSVNFDSFSHSYIYDQAGNVDQETRIDQSQIHHSYDPCFRPLALTSPHITQSATYSTRGNLETLATSHHNLSYQYDSLDRLISDTYHSYEYDPLHNRTRIDENESQYNELNQISSPDLAYDLCGNLTRYGTLKFQYDALDRLIEVRTPEKIHTYSYDAQHRRIAKDGVPYIWDGDFELGTEECYRILGNTSHAEIGAAVAIYFQGKPLVPVFDIHGNQAGLKDLKGGTFESQSFTPFGDRCVKLATHWGYASKHYDAESGLIYFGRRYYSPELGRFITPDPEGYLDSANLYQYCLNNPLSNKDPYGLMMLMGPTITMMNDYDLQQGAMGFPRACLRFTHDVGAGIGQLGDYAYSTISYPFQSSYSSFSESLGDISSRWYNIRQQGHSDIDRFMQFAGADLNHRGFQATSKFTEITLDAVTVAYTGSLFLKSAQAALGGCQLLKGLQWGETSKAVTSTMELSKEFEAAGKVFQKPNQYLSNPSYAYDSLQNWNLNAFKGKSFEDIDLLFRSKGFVTKGPAPEIGKGAYFHPITNRKYYLDYAGKTYRKGIKELPHVDVHYRSGKLHSQKRKYPLGDKLYD